MIDVFSFISLFLPRLLLICDVCPSPGAARLDLPPSVHPLPSSPPPPPTIRPVGSDPPSRAASACALLRPARHLCAFAPSLPPARHRPFTAPHLDHPTHRTSSPSRTKEKRAKRQTTSPPPHPQVPFHPPTPLLNHVNPQRRHWCRRRRRGGQQETQAG